MKTALLSVALWWSVVLWGILMPSFASQAGPRVAIMPFTTGGQENVDYVADGLRDMIASRVASGSGLAVIDPGVVKAHLTRTGKETLTPEKLREVGRLLGADYVIFGSTAQMGNGLIIVISMLPVSAGGAAVPVFSKTLELDDVIPRMQLVAQEITAGIAQGLKTPGATPAGVSSSGKPEVPVKDGDGTATAGFPGEHAGEMPLQAEESDETLPSLPPEEAPQDDSSEAPVQKEEAPGGLKRLLLDRKVDSEPAPENPVYQESLEDLQQDTGAAP